MTKLTVTVLCFRCSTSLEVPIPSYQLPTSLCLISIIYGDRISNFVNLHWNDIREKRCAVKAGEVLFMLLAVLKHDGW